MYIYINWTENERGNVITLWKYDVEIICLQQRFIASVKQVNKDDISLYQRFLDIFVVYYCKVFCKDIFLPRIGYSRGALEN